ncbi:FadR/GntR family transcriptional regulator [Sphingobium boeckii]|uniref:GntR family transcriptional repressor for pyruvate dehydrogenase complex n=1 Tax=Sphingobium boeckii TaxID=1082345 RepID=A0A7W9AHY8_9SPHN|nr:GntR family transcriptional repressor for pyruvate dehydrogenase complex [Sphingobium boeckii]
MTGRAVIDGARPDQPVRLYKKVARQIIEDIQAGKYAVGDRLPAERDLAATHGVSRPAIREAILALEVSGLVEVRIGSGAYVVRVPGDDAAEPQFAISAFEAIEARLLIDSEAAALAALQITDGEIAELDHLVSVMAAGNQRGGSAEEAESAFSLVIARATRNAAIEMMHAELWKLRSSSPDCALIMKKARSANIRPVIEEYSAIVTALRERNPAKAREATRVHLTAVIDHLLFAIEEEAVAAARQSVQTTRKRYAQIVSL